MRRKMADVCNKRTRVDDGEHTAGASAYAPPNAYQVHLAHVGTPAVSSSVGIHTCIKGQLQQVRVEHGEGAAAYRHVERECDTILG